MVVYVRDAAAGDVVVMAGVEEIVIRDLVLVGRLAQAQQASRPA